MTYDIKLDGRAGAGYFPRWTLDGGANVRTTIQNAGYSRIYVRTAAEEGLSMAATLKSASANGAAYIDVALAGVKQGMVVTSTAVGVSGAHISVMVARVEAITGGYRVYLHGGVAVTQTAGTAVTFSCTEYGHGDFDYIRGLRLEAGEVYTTGGQQGAWPGKGGTIIRVEPDGEASVIIIHEEN